MNSKISSALKNAVGHWLNEAIPHIKGRREQMAELRNGLEGDGCDVRVIYHLRANCITIETFDMANRTFTEILRDQFVPDDRGFATPTTSMKQ
jgi:hypothetical protein